MDLVALRFPTVDEQRELFYPTAYVDHGGEDWNCGDITYDGHQGTDFGVGSWSGMEEGREVVAAANGIVVDVHDGEYDRCTGESADCSGYGNYVFLRHADGRYSFYGHMAQDSVSVSLGEFVACGEPLGMVGSSGHSTGPHLHFEVRDPDWSVVEPFAGACGARTSSWDSQGEYDGTPATTCPSYPGCDVVATLTCGDTWVGRNDDPGSTDNVAWYGCTEGTEEGNEMSFAFVTDRDEPVSVRVTGLASDLDLFLMPGTACDGQACLASSAASNAAPEHLTFDATAGATYTLMVDGYAGGASEFTLAVECEGGLPQDEDSAAPGHRAQAEVTPAETGCGCDAGGPAGTTAGLGLVLSAWFARPGRNHRGGGASRGAARLAV